MNESTFSAGFSERNVKTLRVAGLFRRADVWRLTHRTLLLLKARYSPWEVLISRLWINDLAYWTSGCASIIYTHLVVLQSRVERLKGLVLQIWFIRHCKIIDASSIFSTLSVVVVWSSCVNISIIICIMSLSKASGGQGAGGGGRQLMSDSLEGWFFARLQWLLCNRRGMTIGSTWWSRRRCWKRRLPFPDLNDPQEIAVQRGCESSTRGFISARRDKSNLKFAKAFFFLKKKSQCSSMGSTGATCMHVLHAQPLSSEHHPGSSGVMTVLSFEEDPVN